MKRRPIEPTERIIDGYSAHPHLAFQTRPHQNIVEYSKARKIFDKFKEPIKRRTDLERFLQDFDTYGNRTYRPRAKRRLTLFAEDIRDRAAVGDDGLVNEKGDRLKPREVDGLISRITNGEMNVSADQQRQVRQRVKNGSKILSDAYIEVTTSVSAADAMLRGLYANYNGKGLKSRIKLIPTDDGQ